MTNQYLKRYRSLNPLAEQGGVVLLGGSEDCAIPLCELKQAFALQSDLFNRSIPDLTVKDAANLYREFVSGLCPQTLLLHLGAADLRSFREDNDSFDRAYRALIGQIRRESPDAVIAVVSLKNPEKDPDIAVLNQHLKSLAQSEQCEYCDISEKRVWNPRQTKDVISFVYSIGFIRPLNTPRPLYDLVRILFCYQD